MFVTIVEIAGTLKRHAAMSLSEANLPQANKFTSLSNSL